MTTIFEHTFVDLTFGIEDDEIERSEWEAELGRYGELGWRAVGMTDINLAEGHLVRVLLVREKHTKKKRQPFIPPL